MVLNPPEVSETICPKSLNFILRHYAGRALSRKIPWLICAAYASVCVIVWGLSGPRGLLLPSCLMWAQMSTQLDLTCSICLQECVCACVYDCEWFITVRGKQWSDPWCASNLQNSSTPFGCISKVHLWQRMLAVKYVKSVISFLDWGVNHCQLSWWILLSRWFWTDNYPV